MIPILTSPNLLESKFEIKENSIKNFDLLQRATSNYTKKYSSPPSPTHSIIYKAQGDYLIPRGWLSPQQQAKNANRNTFNKTIYLKGKNNSLNDTSINPIKLFKAVIPKYKTINTPDRFHSAHKEKMNTIESNSLSRSNVKITQDADISMEINEQQIFNCLDVTND